MLAAIVVLFSYYILYYWCISM